MARRSKAKKRKGRSIGLGWWTSMEEARRRWLTHAIAKSLLFGAVLTAIAMAASLLEANVKQQLVERVSPTVAFVDLPEGLEGLARADLYDVVGDLPERDWTADRLCRNMALRLADCGWFARVPRVRRTGDARFEISGQYRQPAAIVQQGGEFLLVDAQGVRLPGTYLYSPSWKLVQGVEEPAPAPGALWNSRGLVAGLDLIDALATQPFGSHVTGVLVGNVGGRIDPAQTHIELATDRSGGRIHWGSAPGEEIEENTVEQKLAILRENYRRTGRGDANHPVIDVSTFPDRFTIPG